VAGYVLTANDRASIVGLVEELLLDRLDAAFELLEVADARRGGRRARRLADAGFSIPLRIVVRGPATLSRDYVRGYVLAEIQGRARNLENYLKAFDRNAFRSVHVTAAA
jgi:hypothetical protein